MPTRLRFVFEILWRAGILLAPILYGDNTNAIPVHLSLPKPTLVVCADHNLPPFIENLHMWQFVHRTTQNISSDFGPWDACSTASRFLFTLCGVRPKRFYVLSVFRCTELLPLYWRPARLLSSGGLEQIGAFAIEPCHVVILTSLICRGSLQYNLTYFCVLVVLEVSGNLACEPSKGFISTYGPDSYIGGWFI